MTDLTLHRTSPSLRLTENLRDIPFAIHEHLLSEDSVLRPKQREAISAVSEKVFAQASSLAMIMPTGTGKTVIIAQMLKGLKLDEQSNHSAKKALIVSDSKEGVRQTKDKLQKYAGIDAGAYYDDEKDLTKDVCITTYHSWQRKDFPIDPLDTDLVILDESHKSISKARLNTLKKYDNAIWMAFTATPTYSEERDLLSYFELGYKLTLPEAVEHKLICGFRNILLRSDIDIDLEEVGTLSNGEYNEKALARALNKEARNRIAGEHLLYGVHPDTGKSLRDIRGIISCVDVKHAVDIEDHINKMYSAAYPENTFEHGFVRAIHGDSKDRDDLLQWHKEGKIGYLAYADLLNQNYDDCGIGVCLNLRLSRSKVLVMQRAGRAERLDENDPYKVALIIDVLDTYKGKSNKHPLFYADAIGNVAVISAETKEVLEKIKAQKKSSAIRDLSKKEIEAIKELELRIVTDEKELLSLLHVDDEEVVRSKTDNDLTIPDLVRITNLSKSKIDRCFDSILSEWSIWEEDRTKNKPLIIIEKVKTETGHTINSIRLEQFETFKTTYLANNLVSEKTDQDLAVEDLAAITGASKSTISATFRKIQLEEESYKTNPNLYKQPSVTLRMIKVSGGKSASALPKEKLDIFKKEYLSTFFLRVKDKSDLSIPQIAKLTGLSCPTIAKSFEQIHVEWENYNDNKLNQNQPPIPLYKVREKSRVLDVIRQEDLELYKSKYLNIYSFRPKEDDDLSISDLEKLTGLSRPTIEKTFTNILMEWEVFERDQNKQEKPKVSIEKVRFQTRPYITVIKKSQFELYKTSYLSNNLIPQKTANDLTIPDINRITGLSRKAVNNAFKRLELEWENHEANPEVNKAPSVSVRKVISNHQVANVISKNQLDAFSRDYLPDNSFRSKTDTDLTVGDLMQITGMTQDSINRGFKDAKQEMKAYELNKDTSTKPVIVLEKVKGVNGKPADSISLDQLDIFIEKFFPQRVVDFKQNKDMAIAQWRTENAVTQKITP